MSLKEKIENTSYEIVEERDNGEVVLKAPWDGEEQKELWVKRLKGEVTGYAVVLDDGTELEFVREL